MYYGLSVLLLLLNLINVHELRLRVLKLNNVKSQSRGCGTYRNSGHECPPTDLSDDCVTGGGNLQS